MYPEKTLRSYSLAEGLQATVEDGTSHYFGGYYHVRLHILVDVRISEGWFDSRATYRDAVARLGERVIFTRTFEKMAVPDNEIDAVRATLQNAFEMNLLPYLLRDDFPRRFVESEIKKALKATTKTYAFTRG